MSHLDNFLEESEFSLVEDQIHALNYLSRALAIIRKWHRALLDLRDISYLAKDALVEADAIARGEEQS